MGSLSFIKSQIRYSPTRSHTSAPSKEAMVTSNGSCPFLIQTSLFLKRSPFLVCRMILISPKVSKEILTRVVTLLRSKLKANSWKNTESVIKWFRKLENKKKLPFIQFDICEFYPSISETLLP